MGPRSRERGEGSRPVPPRHLSRSDPLGLYRTGPQGPGKEQRVSGESVTLG